MAKFNKIDTISIIRSTGIVPVFYYGDFSVAKKVVKACYDGGIRAFEFTNRGDGADEVFKELIAYVRKECPEMALGAGTILDAGTASAYIQAGADFLVSPCTVDEIIPLANRRGVPYCPGCGTVTEIVHAIEKGCDLVKIFPAGNVGGPSFVKNVRGPLPWVMFMATGAVEPTEENLSAWAASGVTAVGMGSKLFPKAAIASGDWAAITDLCRSSLAWFHPGK
ncbi:MAG: bifunctional 4-hydroxy-2-oxoglutarate aldolase/2-dehydro-3-deoxy-phosphogluconate aldolase [Oscillospiraceae bacterium]|nr:bifunctional 4-hydroxy-2-oxoglutarate aldolase/2-dehydro-3-deoxy-phosphogluconate aldolase [Oscillospiraceae bacterium]